MNSTDKKPKNIRTWLIVLGVIIAILISMKTDLMGQLSSSSQLLPDGSEELQHRDYQAASRLFKAFTANLPYLNEK